MKKEQIPMETPQRKAHTKSKGATDLDKISKMYQSAPALNRKEFTQYVNNILPTLRSYILRRLNMAHATGAMYDSGITPQELIDSVYAELFENFEQKPEKPDEWESWAFKIADKVLKHELKERIFEKQHFINIHKLENLELHELEEKYTVDGEGKIIMTEELDDVSYHPKLYDLPLILEDHDTLDVINRSLEEYDKPVLHQEIRRQLMKLPEKERTIFDLYWLEEMKIEQIALVRNLSITEAEEILKRVTIKVKNGLEKNLSTKRRPGGN